MRRALVAALAAALALAACGGGSGGGGDAITLQVSGDPAEIEAYRELIRAFEERTPGARVRLIPAGRGDDHMARLATGFAGGAPPDLFLINYRRFGQFSGRGVLEPLGPRLAASATLREDAFYPQPLDAFRVDGTLVCLPQNISSLVVYYNTDLFERFGVEPPKAGWTWEDFLRTAKALTRDTDGDGKTDVYGVGVEPNLVRVASFVWQAGGEVVDDVERPTRVTLLDDKALAALRFFIELRRVHRVAPSLAEAESEDFESRFIAGRLAMLLESRRATPTLREAEGLRFDVAPLPRNVRAATILHSDAYCMAAASPRKDAAFRFVEFALSGEGAAIIARSGRTVPSVRAVAESEAFLDPSKQPASARVFLDAVEHMRRFPNVFVWHEVETKADPIVEEWFYGLERIEALGIEIDIATREILASREP